MISIRNGPTKNKNTTYSGNEGNPVFLTLLYFGTVITKEEQSKVYLKRCFQRILSHRLCYITSVQWKQEKDKGLINEKLPGKYPTGWEQVSARASCHGLAERERNVLVSICKMKQKGNVESVVNNERHYWWIVLQPELFLHSLAIELFLMSPFTSSCHLHYNL